MSSFSDQFSNRYPNRASNAHDWEQLAKPTIPLSELLGKLAMAASCIWSYAKTFREELETDEQRKAWLERPRDPFFTKRLYYVYANVEQSVLPVFAARPRYSSGAARKLS